MENQSKVLRCRGFSERKMVRNGALSGPSGSGGLAISATVCQDLSFQVLGWSLKL
jgi:hypothetical protein